MPHELKTRLTGLLVSTLNCTEGALTDGATLTQLGADTLDLVELRMVLEEEFRDILSNELPLTLTSDTTFGGIVRTLQEHSRYCLVKPILSDDTGILFNYQLPNTSTPWCDIMLYLRTYPKVLYKVIANSLFFTTIVCTGLAYTTHIREYPLGMLALFISIAVFGKLVLLYLASQVRREYHFVSTWGVNGYFQDRNGLIHRTITTVGGPLVRKAKTITPYTPTSIPYTGNNEPTPECLLPLGAEVQLLPIATYCTNTYNTNITRQDTKRKAYLATSTGVHPVLYITPTQLLSGKVSIPDWATHVTVPGI